MSCLMGFFLNLLFGLGKKADRKSINKELEHEMDWYGLSQDEKKLVRSGQYDPWNFEAEELDEEDYYYDDEPTK